MKPPRNVIPQVGQLGEQETFPLEPFKAKSGSPGAKFLESETMQDFLQQLLGDQGVGINEKKKSPKSLTSSRISGT